MDFGMDPAQHSLHISTFVDYYATQPALALKSLYAIGLPIPDLSLKKKAVLKESAAFLDRTVILPRGIPRARARNMHATVATAVNDFHTNQAEGQRLLAETLYAAAIGDLTKQVNALNAHVLEQDAALGVMQLQLQEKDAAIEWQRHRAERNSDLLRRSMAETDMWQRQTNSLENLVHLQRQEYNKLKRRKVSPK